MSDVPQDDWSLPDHFIKSVVCCHPFLSKNVPIQFDYKTAVLSALQSNTSPVDISCCTEGESFCGNPIHREKVDMKIADFTAAWIAYGNQQQHWALELDLNLYLSQCCFSSPGEPTTCDIDPSCISLPLPPVLCNEGVSNNQSNLWMNIQPARSTLHYDASHNLLLLLTGRKVVTLLSPSCTPYLQPVSASDANPNHSRLSFCEVEALVNDRYRSDAGLDHTDCFLYRAVMDAGDALFIPEGWWHQVESEQCSMAVNFWFSLEAGADCTKVAAAPGEDGKGSAISQASNTSVDMRPYKLRKLVHEMVRDALSENSAALAPLCGSDLAFQYSADLAYESFETALLSLLSDAARVSTESDGQLLFNGSNVDGVSGQCRNERKRGAAAIAPADLPHSSSSPEQRWLAFVSASVHEQRRLWLPFANKHPAEWTQALLSLPPSAAARMLDYWDTLVPAESIPASSPSSAVDTYSPESQASMEQVSAAERDSQAANSAVLKSRTQLEATVPVDGLDGFFKGIFEPCGERVPEVRRRLIEQKNAYSQEVARRTLGQILGMTL